MRERLPDQEPIRAWVNVEFLSLDGRMNEVDPIVLTAKWLFLVEIKSRPGEVSCDRQRWYWKDGTSQFDVENPLRLANLKSKRLADLLSHQRVVGAARLPFIEPLIFCPAPGIKLRLPAPLDQRVFGRERGDGGAGTAPGIISALTDQNVGPSSRVGVDATMARIVAKAMNEAGLRAAVKAQQVGDYKLGALLGEGARPRRIRPNPRFVPVSESAGIRDPFRSGGSARIRDSSRSGGSARIRDSSPIRVIRVDSRSVPI